MGDLLVEYKAFILKLLTGVLGTFFGWLNHKYALGLDPTAIAGVTASIIIGIAIHFAAKDHGVNAAKAGDPPAPADPKPDLTKVASLLLIGFLALGALGGCKYIDAKTLKEFQTDDASMMVELGKYLDSDQAAGKKTPDAVAAEKQTISKHNAQVVADVRAVDPAEQQALVAEFLAYVQSDPKTSAGLKKAWSNVAEEHLRLFSSVHR